MKKVIENTSLSRDSFTSNFRRSTITLNDAEIEELKAGKLVAVNQLDNTTVFIEYRK